MIASRANSVSRLLAAMVAVLLVGGIGTTWSAAQNAVQPPAANQQLPNAFQGFTRNRKDPVKIEANTLEVKDKEKVAIFRGNVVVTQGDTQMRCKELEVHYEGNALGADPRQNVPATKTQQQNASAQRIKRLIAVGGVIVIAKDQKATGDKGIFEMAANTVTLDGNVIVTQGQNVMRGDKLLVNLTDGTSKLDGVKKQGVQRVEGLFFPSSMDKDKDKDKDKKGAADKKNSPARKKQPPAN
jgi:lipopolysaccharide export system protein LptA